MATDRISNAVTWAAITPSDTATIEPLPVAVHVGGAGTVVAVGADGNDATFVCVAGQTLNVQPMKVKAASTATDLVAMYN